MKVFDAKTCWDTTALQPVNRIKTVYVNVCMCLNALLWQWCHCCLVYPHLTQYTHTQTHPHPPLSLAALASCLSCWSQLTEYGGTGGVWRKRAGGGWVDSWADAEAPPGFAGDGLFPSHPAAVQLPRHQLSWWSHQADQGLPYCGGWLRKEWRWYSVVALYGPADTLWSPRTRSHHNSRPKLSQTKHAWKCTVSPLTSDHWLVHNNRVKLMSQN